MITLLASAARTASGNSEFSIAKFERVAACIYQLTVSEAATASADTLDVYVQHSPDEGTTWDDFIHFTQVLGDGGAKTFLATWSGGVVAESELKAPADGALAAGVLHGPVAGDLRVKWVIVDDGADNASFTFGLTANPIYIPR